MPKTKSKNLIPRPPIVVVMGHIDHGKTTLLDYIRKTKVTESEAGGITQRAAAYEVSLDPTRDKKMITFLDTPGHEAFTSIRKRGAKIADIAVLVIAADDKVNEQTIESIETIKEANMPFVVAINKVDKESANAEKIKKELSEKEIFLEEWGGKIPCVNISAKTGQGVNELLEMIVLLADMEELKTNPQDNASGFVLESHIDGKRGIAATLLIQNGQLKKGMYVASGDAMAPVRIFEDFSGAPIAEAGAAAPVKIVGFNKSPEVGTEFKSFDSKKDAKKSTNAINAKITKLKLGFSSGPEKEKQTLIPIVIKTDVAGSAEAIEKQIKKLDDEKISFNILRAETGVINEDDIKLASSGEKAIAIGFNTNCPAGIKTLAERLGVTVKLFDIIYEAEDWLKKEAKKREPIEEKEEVIGKAKILKIFRDEKNKKIVGGEATEGKILPGKNVKIYRRDFLLGEGKILELKKMQTRAEEIKEGEQFGALIQTKAPIEPKDTLEVIEKVKS